MSGYLEVKSNLYLKPFKSWKRQWCKLQPSSTRALSGCLAVYSSEAGSAAGSIEFPPGSTVRRTKSRSRPYAFAVFSSEELRKPIILLAANSDNDAQVWMKNLKALFSEENPYFGPDTLKDTYSITLISTDLSHKCGLITEETNVSVSGKGIIISHSDNRHFTTVLPWECIKDIELSGEQGAERDCTLYIDSTYEHGAGHVTLRRASSSLTTAILEMRPRAIRSESDLRTAQEISLHGGDAQSSSSYSGPSEESLEDEYLAMSKGAPVMPDVQVSKGDRASLLQHDDSGFDRRSIRSVASGIYEEIRDPPASPAHGRHTDADDDTLSGPCILKCGRLADEEPAYESVAECRPPPLPPRVLLTSSPSNVTRHSSLSCLRVCPGADYSKHTKTLPSKSRQAFNAFRKRLTSDSRINHSKCDSKENKHDETKKKRFDFTPSKDLFRNFRGKKHKKSTGNLTKIGETKSCEFLDETEHVTTNRCSKSVECLDDDRLSELGDLSDDASFQLPRDIVALILRGRGGRVRQSVECAYIPMSPIAMPPPIESDYMVMSPRPNIATL